VMPNGTGCFALSAATAYLPDPSEAETRPWTRCKYFGRPSAAADRSCLKLMN